MKSDREKTKGQASNKTGGDNEQARLTGTIGSDWLQKQGAAGTIADDVLRDWRDELEQQLKERLGVDADLSLGSKTRFAFITPPQRHTIVEIESFAHKTLDSFLDRRSRA